MRRLYVYGCPEYSNDGIDTILNKVSSTYITEGLLSSHKHVELCIRYMQVRAPKASLAPIHRSLFIAYLSVDS